jgi:hypothetical protein
MNSLPTDFGSGLNGFYGAQRASHGLELSYPFQVQAQAARHEAEIRSYPLNSLPKSVDSVRPPPMPKVSQPDELGGAGNSGMRTCTVVP